MAKVYRLKEGIDLNKLAELGFDIVSANPFILCKEEIQPLESPLVQGSLANIYNSDEYYKKFYKKNRKKLERLIGLYYVDKKAIMTEKFTRCLCNWRIQVEPYDDGWLGFASADPCENKVFYSAKHIEDYCAETLVKMKELDLVELIDVEE